jgi:dihydropteroate synthase
MTGFLEAIPRRGMRSEGALPLAGSSHVWFDTVHRYGDSTAAPISLSPGETRRLSDDRAHVCGLSMDRPRIMGILNVTPDSFSDGGDLSDPGTALERARAMSEAADILDIGGESTRPGADEVPIDVEIARTVPVIEAIRAAGIATPISIDTRKARVAEAALDAGADMVNDVAAMTFDPDMASLVAARGVPVCLMHAQGDPKTMQNAPAYGDVVADVGTFLARRIEAATEAGIARERIVVDPGIGFGKTVQHNVSILRHLSVYHDLGCPILLGVSRKRFIGSIGGAEAAKDRMPGSVVAALHGVGHGAQIIRVHDVNETRQALRLYLAMNEVE